jgi:hypothetical protein
MGSAIVSQAKIKAGMGAIDEAMTAVVSGEVTSSARITGARRRWNMPGGINVPFCRRIAAQRMEVYWQKQANGRMRKPR